MNQQYRQCGIFIQMLGPLQDVLLASMYNVYSETGPSIIIANLCFAGTYTLLFVMQYHYYYNSQYHKLSQVTSYNAGKVIFIN